MKHKDNSKRSISGDRDKFDRKTIRSGSVKKDKSSKKRLSIYDEFNEDDLGDFEYNSDSLLDSPWDE